MHVDTVKNNNCDCGFGCSNGAPKLELDSTYPNYKKYDGCFCTDIPAAAIAGHDTSGQDTTGSKGPLTKCHIPIVFHSSQTADSLYAKFLSFFRVPSSFTDDYRKISFTIFTDDSAINSEAQFRWSVIDADNGLPPQGLPVTTITPIRARDTFTVTANVASTVPRGRKLRYQVIVALANPDSILGAGKSWSDTLIVQQNSADSCVQAGIDVGTTANYISCSGNVDSIHLTLYQLVGNDTIIINQGDTAFIDTTPSMPSFIAQVNEPSLRSYVWQYWTNYNVAITPTPALSRNDTTKIPATGWASTLRNNVWNLRSLLGTSYFGGNGTNRCKAVNLIGDTLQDSINYLLYGRNPTRQTVRHYCSSLAGDSLRNQLTAYWESRFSQFAESPATIFNYHLGPLPPLVTSDGGFGIMQLTTVPSPRPTSDHIWNWQSNVSAGVQKLEANVNIADEYVRRTRTGQSFQGIGWGSGNVVPTEGTAYPNAPDMTVEQKLLEIWSLYNSPYRYHDYDPNSNTWVQRPNSGAPGIIYADNLLGIYQGIQSGSYPSGWN